mgnify:CR=1 FL=1
MKKVLFLVLFLLGCGKYREIKLPSGQENKYEELLCEKAENECGLFIGEWRFGNCVRCLSGYYEQEKDTIRMSKEDVYKILSNFDCEQFEYYSKEIELDKCIK